MRARHSAGIVLYRLGDAGIEVLLVHPGGPYWANKDLGAWSIPKGEFDADEAPAAAARREFAEEVGFEPRGDLQPLEPVRQSGGKVVHAWALAGDCEPAAIRSNTFSMEWPPRSGREREFPEVDRAGWFSLDEAATKLVTAQVGLLEQLRRLLEAR